MAILPPRRMLATGIADLDQQVIDWMRRAPGEVHRYFGEDEGVDDEGTPVIICYFVEVGAVASVEVCRAKSYANWSDAVRNCLNIALLLEPAGRSDVTGLDSLQALEALAISKGLR